jgi:REP element-mobilizing transposase RayT
LQLLIGFDLFIREIYKEEILKSIRYCQANKGLELYGWSIMTSHVHMIIGTSGNSLQNIMRDLKRHTSETLHKSIQTDRTKSRREWILG